MSGWRPSLVKKDDLEQFWRGFEYNFETQRSKLIRIFVSSTFTDSSAERNYLSKVVYPELRDYFFTEYGYDFQIVDMRWGITDNATSKNITTDICLNEIRNCRNESSGPFFMGFLSHRYGNKFLLPEVKQTDFTAIRNEINNLRLDNSYKGLTETRSLLDHCYKLDENQIPSVYRLLSIKEIIFEYDPNKKRLSNEWYNMEKKLKSIIQQCAKSLYDRNEFSFEQMNQFFMSITETEMVEGIFNLSKEEAADRTLVIYREIENLENIALETSDKKLLARYMDIKDNTIDKQDIYMLNELKRRLKEYLPPENVIQLKTKWSPENNGVSFESDPEYFKEFATKFKEIVISLFKSSFEQLSNVTSCYFTESDLWLGEELIFQFNLRNKLASKLKNRNNTLKEAIAYIKKGNDQKILVIHGDTGSGKSSMLAFLAKNVPNLLPKLTESTILFRFLGTTRASSDLKSTYLTLICQLRMVYQKKSIELNNSFSFNMHKDLQPLETNELKEYFLEFLEFISVQFPTEKIHIFIDSIDQLAKDELFLNSLIYSCPKNTKIVYSVLTNFKNIHVNMQVLVKESKNFLELKPMNYHTSIKTFGEFLQKANKRLTTDQMGVVSHLFRSAELLPLYIQLIFNIVTKWTSYSPIDEKIYKCTSIDNCIKYIFKHLEAIYGEKFVSRLFFYFNQFSTGIAEQELADIMSIDDDLLKVVFQYHEPPQRRFPNAIWTRLKNEIKDYVTVKEEDDNQIICWFHRAFKTVSNEMYVDSISAYQYELNLINIYHYFRGTYRVIEKEFEYNELIARRMGKKFSKAKRLTKDQKMILYDPASNSLSFNLRKLNELPRLLVKIKDKNLQKLAFETEIFFNVEFIFAKISLNDSSFLTDTKQAMWQLYNHFKHETQLKKLFEAQVIRKKNPINSLMTAFIIYSQNFLVLTKHPQSLTQQLRSRLFGQVDEYSPMNSLLIHDQHFLTEFTNNIKINRRNSRLYLENTQKKEAHRGSLVPLTSFLPLTNLSFNETFTSAIPSSIATLLWLDSYQAIVKFDYETKKLLLNNYHTELTIGELSLDYNENEFICLKAALISAGLEILENILDIKNISGYYFLLRNYHVMCFKLSSNKKVSKINLKRLHETFMNKYADYTTDDFEAYVLNYFTPIPPHYYVLVSEYEVTISSVVDNKKVFEEKFNKIITSHHLNIDTQQVILPKANNVIYLIITFEDFELQVYQITNLMSRAIVKLILSIPGVELKSNGLFGKNVIIAFDRNYLVNGDIGSTECPLKSLTHLRFMINENENLFLFEIVQETDAGAGQEFNFSIRKIILFKPIFLDFLGNNVSMITIDKKLVYYNTESKEVLTFNEKLSPSNIGIHIVSSHSLILWNEYKISVIKVSKESLDEKRLVAMSEINGKFFHYSNNLLFAQTEGKLMKKVDLGFLSEKVDLNEHIFKIRSTFTYQSEFKLFCINRSYVFDFNDNKVLLIELTTKNARTILVLSEHAKILELLVDKDCVFLLIYEHGFYYLSISRIDLNSPGQLVNQTKTQINMINPKRKFFISNYFLTTNSNYIFYSKSQDEPLSKPSNKLLINKINTDSGIFKAKPFQLKSDYKFHFLTHRDEFLICVGRQIELYLLESGRKLAVYELGTQFSGGTKFELIKDTNNFIIFHENQMFYVELTIHPAPQLQFFVCNHNYKDYKIQGNIVCLRTEADELTVQKLNFENKLFKMDCVGSFECQELKNYWLSSCGQLLIVQDTSNCLKVIEVSDGKIIAELPVLNEIKGFFTQDDLIVAALDTGNLASLLMIKDIRCKMDMAKENILNINPTSDKTDYLDDYLSHFTNNLFHKANNLEKLRSLNDYDDELFEKFLNKNDLRSLIAPVSLTEAPKVKNLEGLDFQMVNEDRFEIKSVTHGHTNGDVKNKRWLMDNKAIVNLRNKFKSSTNLDVRIKKSSSCFTRFLKKLF